MIYISALTTVSNPNRVSARIIPGANLSLAHTPRRRGACACSTDRKKLLTTVDKHKDLEIYCNDEILFKDHTLKFVYVTRWRTKDPPLVLQYCAKPGTEVEG